MKLLYELLFFSNDPHYSTRELINEEICPVLILDGNSQTLCPLSAWNLFSGQPLPTLLKRGYLLMIIRRVVSILDKRDNFLHLMPNIYFA